MNSAGFVETIGQDLRYGARLLRRNPTFATVAILTLGANRGMVIWMVVREAAVLLGIGLVVGAGLSAFAGRAAETLLYGLRPGDPATIALAMAGLAAVTLVASWVPARRASRLAPTVALREE
jgi:ABC-type antimicrobial peptide transport system permease subunit